MYPFMDFDDCDDLDDDIDVTGTGEGTTGII